MATATPRKRASRKTATVVKGHVNPADKLAPFSPPKTPGAKIAPDFDTRLFACVLLKPGEAPKVIRVDGLRPALAFAGSFNSCSVLPTDSRVVLHRVNWLFVEPFNFEMNVLPVEGGAS